MPAVIHKDCIFCLDSQFPAAFLLVVLARPDVQAALGALHGAFAVLLAVLHLALPRP